MPFVQAASRILSNCFWQYAFVNIALPFRRDMPVLLCMFILIHAKQKRLYQNQSDMLWLIFLIYCNRDRCTKLCFAAFLCDNPDFVQRLQKQYYRILGSQKGGSAPITVDISMADKKHRYTVYVRRGCPYCKAAMQLVRKNALVFKKRKIEIDVLPIDKQQLHALIIR